MQDKVSKRIVWADSLKGCLMMVVIFSHALQTALGLGSENNHLFNIICSFQMPAFVAVSGYLAYRPEGRFSYTSVNSCFKIVYRRVRQLIIPFLLWDLLKLVTTNNLSFSGFVDFLLYPDYGYWFLWVLFFIFVIFVLSAWFSYYFSIKQEIVMTVVCLILIVIMVLFNIRIFGFQFIAYYFLFYILGYYLHKYEKELITKRFFYITILAMLWLVLAWFWKMHELPVFLKGIHMPETMMQYTYRFVTALAAVYVLLALSPLVLNRRKKWNEPLEKIGIVSLGLYTSHLIVMKWIVSFYKDLHLCNSMVTIISFASALAISWIIVWGLGKWNLTARLLLGKI